MIGSMRRLVCALVLAALLVPASASAELIPGRAVSNPAAVTALSVTHESVVWAVGRSAGSCGYVRLWETWSKSLWSFGRKTIVGCEEGPSAGFGIAQVAASGRRAFWVTNIGGNFTDYALWTATPTHPSPRRLAFASAETGAAPAIVLGVGTPEGVPYAVGDTVTYVAPDGTRLFRVSLDSPVRLLAAGPSFGNARVVAALENGDVTVLSRTGARLRTDTYEPGTVRSVQLAYGGPVVQVGNVVTVGSGATGAKVMLPAGAVMLDYRQRTIVYRLATQARTRAVGSGADTLAQRFRLEPWQPMLLSLDWGYGWAKGTTVYWRT
jgi:hypothetical protein